MLFRRRCSNILLLCSSDYTSTLCMSDTFALLASGWCNTVSQSIGTLAFGDAATATILAAVVGACLLLLCIAGQLINHEAAGSSGRTHIDIIGSGPSPALFRASRTDRIDIPV
ncbi:hypothetical protein KCU81_g351, partial [Aureobasidium melanogenum]